MTAMRTGLRCATLLAAILGAIAVQAAVPAVAPAQAGPAVTCMRVVSIAPQETSAESTGKLIFDVYTGGCLAAGEVSFETLPGTAVPGLDFKQQKAKLAWAAGETAGKKITVVIVLDAVPEVGLEDFAVRLYDPTPGVVIDRMIGDARILDGPAPLLSIDNSSCPANTPNPRCVCPALFEPMPYEPNCGRPELDLSTPQGAPVTFHWKTKDGSAIAWRDYIPVSAGFGTIRIGSTTGQVRVELLERPPNTPARSFSIEITDVSLGAIADGSAVITIGGP